MARVRRGILPHPGREDHAMTVSMGDAAFAANLDGTSFDIAAGY